MVVGAHTHRLQAAGYNTGYQGKFLNGYNIRSAEKAGFSKADGYGPEGWDYWYKTVNYASGDQDIFLFSNLTNVGAIEVNAFQSIADVVIQKSTREGFGLTVTEVSPLCASCAR